uniref:Uncharacterized protein n=1 Tax=Solanum lycopersicum TaxID=4081 RepID=A0A3Q7H7F6_SOLLC
MQTQNLRTIEILLIRGYKYVGLFLCEYDRVEYRVGIEPKASPSPTPHPRATH